MKKKFFRFITVFSVISLIFANSIFVNINFVQASLNQGTVYVKSTWSSGNVGAGLTWGVNAFNSIPTALSNVSAGGTIYLLDNGLAGEDDFSLTGTLVLDKAVSIIGEDLGDDEKVSIRINEIIDEDDEPYSYDWSAFSIVSPNVVIENLKITNNCTYVDQIIYLDGNLASNSLSNINILNNEIIDESSYTSYLIYVSGFKGDVSDINIKDNKLFNNVYTDYLAVIGFDDRATDDSYNLFNVDISNNEIFNNAYGIVWYIKRHCSNISIMNNNIYNNDMSMSFDGIIDNAIVVNNNKIYGNNHSGEKTKVEVYNDAGAISAIDLSNNWWGSETGPNVTIGCWGYDYNDYIQVDISVGHSDASSILYADRNLNSESRAHFSFRPFYTDSDLLTLSEKNIDMSASSSLNSLFNSDSFGTMSISSDDIDESGDTSKVTVNEKTKLELPVNSGVASTTITLEADTEITKADGGTFDYQDLSAAEMATNAFSGFESGELIGALQWGIPSVGLVFSSPVTIEMYVGTELAGQVLELYRSISTSGGWTKDGLGGVGGAIDGTCLVSEAGMCKFDTTKASYFGVLKASSSDDGGDDGSSNSSVPITLPAGIGSGVRDVSSTNIGAALHAGEINGQGVNFLTYVTNQNHFINQDSSNKREKTNHHFVITSLDLNTEIANITFHSDPKTISIKKGETQDLDLDGDKINDIRVTFSNIYVNRAEITVKSLFNTSPVVSEPSNTSTVEIIKITNDIMYNKLKGKIIIKVEDNGRAYYVSPVKKEMYYLGRPTDAFSVMRSQGVGITNSNLEKVLKFGEKISLKVSKLFSKKQAGKIFLQVESKGEAWYIDNDGNRHFLGRPNDAFSVMKSLGLGISNANFSSMSK